MAILAAIPVINCQTIELMLEFYLQLFQFVVIQKRESNGCLQWVHLKHGNTSVMLKSAGSASPGAAQHQQAGVCLYLYVNNIDELHHFIKAKNRTVSDIVLMDYHMHEFRIADPEGNEITVGQSVKPLLNE